MSCFLINFSPAEENGGEMMKYNTPDDDWSCWNLSCCGYESQFPAGAGGDSLYI